MFLLGARAEGKMLLTRATQLFIKVKAAGDIHRPTAAERAMLRISSDLEFSQGFADHCDGGKVIFTTASFWINLNPRFKSSNK